MDTTYNIYKWYAYFVQAEILKQKFGTEDKLTALLEKQPKNMIIQNPVILSAANAGKLKYLNNYSKN